MIRKEQIKQVAKNNVEEEFSDAYFKFIQGAEWADANPSEANISMYLGKKGWPLSTNGIPTYEQANKMMLEYYEYKRKQWVDKVFKYLDSCVTYQDIEDLRKLIEED